MLYAVASVREKTLDGTVSASSAAQHADQFCSTCNISIESCYKSCRTRTPDTAINFVQSNKPHACVVKLSTVSQHWIHLPHICAEIRFTWTWTARSARAFSKHVCLPRQKANPRATTAATAATSTTTSGTSAKCQRPSFQHCSETNH